MPTRKCLHCLFMLQLRLCRSECFACASKIWKMNITFIYRSVEHVIRGVSAKLWKGHRLSSNYVLQRLRNILIPTHLCCSLEINSELSESRTVYWSRSMMTGIATAEKQVTGQSLELSCCLLMSSLCFQCVLLQAVLQYLHLELRRVSRSRCDGYWNLQWLKICASEWLSDDVS